MDLSRRDEEPISSTEPTTPPVSQELEEEMALFIDLASESDESNYPDSTAEEQEIFLKSTEDTQDTQEDPTVIDVEVEFVEDRDGGERKFLAPTLERIEPVRRTYRRRKRLERLARKLQYESRHSRHTRAQCRKSAWCFHCSRWC